MDAESRRPLRAGTLRRMALPVDAWKLEGISPRAYQHPADRAATAALQKVPYLDEVVRKLIALGYERALRAASLGSSVRLGQEQLPHIWVLHRQCFNALDLEARARPLPDAVPDRQRRDDRDRPADRGPQLRARPDPRRRRAPRRARPRGRARALRPRPLPDGDAHPPAPRDRRAAAAAGRPAAAGDPARAARVVPRRRAELRPRGGAGHPRPDGRLPRAHGHLGRRGRGRPQPRRLHRPGRWTTARAARASRASRGCWRTWA